MTRFEKVFITGVIVADLFAVIYFGGHYIMKGSIISHGSHDEHQSLILAHTDDHGTDHAKKEAKPKFDWATHVPDLARGAQLSAKCKACHTFDDGGTHKIGPNLWDIFGKDIAAKDGFNYSSSFVEKKGSVAWDRDALDAFLKNPKKYVPGTKMAFPGIRKAEDRANMIAWIESLK